MVESERRTIDVLRITLFNAQETYKKRFGYGDYGTISQLLSVGLIDDDLGRGTYDNYSYDVNVIYTNGQTPSEFEFIAKPIIGGLTKIHSFYMDSTGIVRGEVGHGVGRDSPPIDD